MGGDVLWQIDVEVGGKGMKKVGGRRGCFFLSSWKLFYLRRSLKALVIAGGSFEMPTLKRISVILGRGAPKSARTIVLSVSVQRRIQGEQSGR